MSDRPRRRRTLTPEEQALWDHVSASVAPRRAVRSRKVLVTPEQKSATPPPEPVTAPAPKPTKRRPLPKPMGKPEPAVTMINALPHRYAGLDGKREERFRKGELEIEARIDLHGMTLDVAHTVLGGFLIQARTRGARCVLVITGKGGPSGQGALKAFVPRWLTEAPFGQMIASVAQAQPRHGGGGALYVYLRRKRA